MVATTGKNEARRKPFTARSIAALVLAGVMAGVIFYMSSIPGSGLPPNLGILSTVAHFCEFALFGMLLAVGLEPKLPKAAVVIAVAVAIASLYGASDEFHQLFVPGRFTDVADWITDTCGALFGAIVANRFFAWFDSRKAQQ